MINLNPVGEFERPETDRHLITDTMDSRRAYVVLRKPPAATRDATSSTSVHGPRRRGQQGPIRVCLRVPLANP
jgi:hypothetical protein